MIAENVGDSKISGLDMGIDCSVLGWALKLVGLFNLELRLWHLENETGEASFY